MSRPLTPRRNKAIMCRLLSTVWSRWMVRVRRNGSGIRTAAAGLGCVLLLAGLAGCAGTGTDETKAASAHDPIAVAKAPAQLPVPRGKGSETPDDFNGDGHPDLVLNDLVKGPDGTHGDDAGIGIVYGSLRGLTPGARQLLSPARQAAPPTANSPRSSRRRRAATWTGTASPTSSSPRTRRTTDRACPPYPSRSSSAPPRA